MPKPKITVKEAKLVKAKANGLTHKQAYDQAGYAPTNYNSSVVNTNKILSRPNVQEALDIALDKYGVTIERAVEPINKALNAKKIVPIEGDFYVTDVDDLDMQLKGSDRALKLMGVSQEKGTNTNNFIQVIKEQSNKYA
jgi:hypothetical protein